MEEGHLGRRMDRVTETTNPQRNGQRMEKLSSRSGQSLKLPEHYGGRDLDVQPINAVDEVWVIITDEREETRRPKGKRLSQIPEQYPAASNWVDSRPSGRLGEEKQMAAPASSEVTTSHRTTCAFKEAEAAATFQQWPKHIGPDIVWEKLDVLCPSLGAELDYGFVE